MAKRPACRGAQHPRLTDIARIRYKPQTVEATDIGPCHADLACSRNLDGQLTVAGKLTDKERGAPIDKPLSDAIVQRIRQPILDPASAILPRAGILDPVTPMADVCPRSDVRDARHQRIDVAVNAIEVCHLAGNPCHGEPLLWAGQMDKTLAQEPRMGVAQHLSE